MSPPTDRTPASPSPEEPQVPDRSLPSLGSQIPGRAGEQTGRHRGGRSYASRDYLCLDCMVPGDCSPASVLCLGRAARRRRRDESQLELLSAVDQLAIWRPAPLTKVAHLLGVALSTLGPPLRRALEAGFLAQHATGGRSSGVCLTPLGRERLADLLDDRPELELSGHQRNRYRLLAAIRDLELLGRVTASLLGRALRRDERNVAARLRRLAALGLVAYDFGHVALTDTGHHLLDTLQAYAVNVRLGPRLLIRARGRYRVEVLTRAHLSSTARPGRSRHAPRRP